MFSLFAPLSYALLWPALIRAVFRNLMAMLHAVAMEIRTLRGCREAFVLLRGCKGLQNTRGRSGMKNFIHRASCQREFCFWENGGKWVSFPGSQSVSRTQKQRSLRLSPAVINTFVEKAGQLSKAGACSVAFVLCKLGALSRYTQTFCLLPVNNAFVFLKEKNAIAFVELRICLMSSVLQQRLCKDHSVKKK